MKRPVTYGMGRWVLPVITAAAWAGCKPTHAGSGEAATYPLSDTMMAAVRIDTTVMRPVDREWRFSGRLMRKAERVWVVAYIPESGVGRVRQGMPAGVTVIGYPDTVFQGWVDRVYRRRGRPARVRKLRIGLPGGEDWPEPGKAVIVGVRYRDGRQMPAIPATAVVTDKGKHFVMVFRDRYNIETRAVDVAQCLDGTAYIQAGLKPGDKVISRNQGPIYHALND